MSIGTESSEEGILISATASSSQTSAKVEASCAHRKASKNHSLNPFEKPCFRRGAAAD